jgi:serine/threonine protein kinase
MSAFNRLTQAFSRSSGPPNITEQRPCETIDGVPLDWSGRGTSHVDYNKSDVLPLTQGKFLGYGIHGGVYETSCNGVKLAWKRKYCRRKIGEEERREIEVIKKLSHRHIIRLMGTYTHGQFLGLLLWPVATCDLASFLEDVDWLQKRVQSGEWMPLRFADWTEQTEEREARLQALGIPVEYVTTTLARDLAVAFLRRTIGCMSSAVAYLHQSDIKHKDLKPSNIVLSKDGLWLTDFGTATDFSVLSSSVTDNGERGTPKYFAPEVAGFEPSGRAADIFSMGCIFFEIMILCIGYTLELSTEIRYKNDKSFQSNLDRVKAWLLDQDRAEPDDKTIIDHYTLRLVGLIMEAEADRRPTADMVESTLAMISGMWSAYRSVHALSRGPDVFRGCCL